MAGFAERHRLKFSDIVLDRGRNADAAEELYFEHHVKLLLPDEAAGTLVALTRLLEPHQARLSRNARRQRDDGRHERFVTQRCHHAGQTTAKTRLAALLTV